jgi:hypothetical protein
VPKENVVLEIHRPHFIVRLYENLLKVDLKGTFKNEIEEALENKPLLKETLGGLLRIFVPLHIRVVDIDSVNVNETGKVRISLPFHRDIVIPLEREDGERLAEKLNQLILEARRKRFEFQRLRKKRARDLKRESERLPPSSYVTVPYYFPTEQVDNVGKLRSRKRRKK